jgi:hypothetical protein
MGTRSAAKGFLGAHLAAGILVFATMTLILAEIAEDVTSREPLTVADAQLSTWLHAHGSPFMTSAMRVATSFGSPVTVTCITVALTFYLL